MLADTATRSDEQLAEVAKRRENHAEASAAFAELQKRHGRAVLSFVARWQADAEDLAQEVWLAVWLKLIEQFSGGNFRAWLFTVARTKRIDRKRRDSIRQTSELTENLDEDSTVEPIEGLVIEERSRALRECIERLNERERCIVLATLGGLKTGAAAKHCQLKPDRAARVKHDATRKLQECTQGKGV